MFSNDLCIYKKEKIVCGEVRVFSDKLDCEQPLFSFRFSKGSARARKRWTAKPRDARREKRGRQPEKKKEFLLSYLSRLTPSVTRVVIYVSRAFCSTDQEKREAARTLLISV